MVGTSKTFGLLSVLVIAASVTGCRVEPIYNVEDRPIATSTQALGPVQVERRIIEAAQAKGWRVERVAPGQLRATIDWRQHSATVNIQYTNTTYNIRYATSTNLKESGGTIHNRFNARVRELEDEIDRRLSKLG
ncbi:hypothetical protein [Reyranella sp. CPCC 100927]|uniref:hypothetical protein n=1 Tax=Reyranella sp. CPCC 100927 TaxID=2599616 RepID=UPI0011B3DDB2|nr:hypothetical protein [Reyranella sp. CPCC 100927]TWT13702.1 hypothetical protein FQU96_07230 [Reyranella sp. CPCC 100927]